MRGLLIVVGLFAAAVWFDWHGNETAKWIFLVDGALVLLIVAAVRSESLERLRRSQRENERDSEGMS